MPAEKPAAAAPPPAADGAGLTLDELKFNDAGLIPVIAQCAQNGEVLMMAWMSRETLQETLTTGNMVYFSRSRNRRWRKGEESGNVQKCLTITADCDGDTLLAKVQQTGPACHTGKRSCFSS